MRHEFPGRSVMALVLIAGLADAWPAVGAAQTPGSRHARDRTRTSVGVICDWGTTLPLTASDSPRGAVLRLLRAYCQRDVEAYLGLLTEDFRFSTLDPTLMAAIPDGLSREDEEVSARNLLLGHQRADGTLEPGARGIRITAKALRVVDDPESVDPIQRCRLVLVDRLIFEYSLRPTMWEIVENGRDIFRVVRGDAAACAEGQKADADHWYIQQWVEIPEAAIVESGTQRIAKRSPSGASAR